MAATAPTILAEEDDLCKLAYSDAKHDFEKHFNARELESTKENIKKYLPDVQNECDFYNEDDYIKNILGLNTEGEGLNKKFTIPAGVGESNKYIKNYTPYMNQDEGQLIDVLKRLGDSIYLIVDTKNAAFGGLLKRNGHEIDLREYTENKPFLYYVQNRQTLYDPLSKVTPATVSGKEIFKTAGANKKFIQFAWEATGPGTTQYITYPSWNTKNDINENFFCKSLLVQPLKLNKNNPLKHKDEYLRQNTYVFLKDRSNIIILNSDIAAKSGGIVTKLMTAMNGRDNDIKEDIKQLFGTGVNIGNIHVAHHYIAKRLGDQGQALSACQKQMYLKKQNVGDIFLSNGKHAFVTIDRLAFAAALMYQTPIVIYTPSGDIERKFFDIYIHKSLNNIDTLLQYYANEFKTLYDRLLNSVEKIAEYDSFVTKYIESNTAIATSLNTLLTRYNTEATKLTKESYKQFLKDFVKETRPIYILNTINRDNLDNLKKDIIDYYTADIQNDIGQLLNNIDDVASYKGRETRTKDQYKKDIVDVLKIKIPILNNIDNLLKTYNELIKDIDLKETADNDSITGAFIEKVNIHDFTKVPRSTRVFAGIIETICGVSILQSINNILGTYNSDIQDSFIRLIKTNIINEWKESRYADESREKAIAIKLEEILDDTEGNQVIEEYTPLQRSINEDGAIIPQRGGSKPHRYQKGGNLIKTFYEYNEKDKYLRSILVLYISALQIGKEINYDIVYDKEEWTKLMSDLLDYAYEQTETYPDTKFSSFSNISEIEKTTSVCYYNYFTDQIRNFPDLINFYYKINSEESTIIDLTEQMYHSIKSLLIDVKSYIKNYNIHPKLSQTTSGKTPMPQYGFHRSSVMYMPPHGILASGKGGGRRYRKTKRRIPRPVSKKQTRRYKNPQRKSRKQSRTRK